MVNNEVKLPRGFIQELIKYLGDKPFHEVENAIYNLRYFMEKSIMEETANGDGSTTESAS